ncbi:methicillin resistance protein [Bifidobacterium lemurum]|uniref:Methicillin resistance protein n=1 Tax=Bifidobacterium lemurum TaxID=1603886 RepID=A0A261FWB0_9BIFI|nr:peptidoglycan bridge formation glycyltransferase FemA/FemB family protein [Bifidobacterium lemurum]OZG63484.1 methicillin resistance protein [Bifidobacterium lemurum]QOL34396.1 peptidoglycan bridge formation glycyltransferase FemA/FemB family protein [Bifidobacterium lemurum]
MLAVEEIHEIRQWNDLVERWHGHPLQSWQWGELKAQTGPWTARRIVVSEDGTPVGGMQVLIRDMPWPFNAICYAPRGPVCDDARLVEIANACAQWCKTNVKAASLKIDPAVEGIDLGDGWKPSEHVLLDKTAIIDLTDDEETIFKNLHSKKARQYIRKAGRDGVVCRPATREDLEPLLKIYHETAAKDGFPLHADEFYHAAFDALDGINQVFVAEHDGAMLSFLWNATTSGTAFELWGGVNDEGKRLRANYLLKWTAIQAAKQRGARIYDLNGLLNDGISDFKLMFVNGPTVWIGSFDYPLNVKYAAMNALIALRRALRALRAGKSASGRH